MSSGSGSSRSAAKRLLRELQVWEKEAPAETGIERLGPVSEDELLRWEAVINGRGVGAGYDDGRWLLSIEIPATYPLAPPKIAFRTQIVHANVALKDGEICLDLLGDAWTPAYSVLECVRAVRLLLSCPGVDSPLNVDVAALIRAGDTLAARRLTEYWCTQEERGRYEGK
ncbi:ubiquitin-conjugating enzyme [Ustulina deusta]|nr:ubiquitin-conjugating enzyme [Ustulina deusta]KAI3342682.1 ubiquitin-conjugating enzyme [Ustulina deusta]